MHNNSNIVYIFSFQVNVFTKLPRDDYKELLNLAPLMIDFIFQFTIRKPGVLHQPHKMTKDIHSLKMKLEFNANETTMVLTVRGF